MNAGEQTPTKLRQYSRDPSADEPAAAYRTPVGSPPMALGAASGGAERLG